MIGRALMMVSFAMIAMITGDHPTAQAHHDNWGLPLIGGLVGGYAAKSLLDAHSEEKNEASPAPAAAPASAGPSATSIEDKLNTLDKLAAGGYITKDEYNARRQALLNEL